MKIEIGIRSRELDSLNPTEQKPVVKILFKCRYETVVGEPVRAFGDVKCRFAGGGPVVTAEVKQRSKRFYHFNTLQNDEHLVVLTPPMVQ